MKPSPETLRHLSSLPEDEISLWLAQSFLEWVQEPEGEPGQPAKADDDPFYPHLFVHYSPRPGEAIKDLYSSAEIPLKRALHRGIQMLGTFCRLGCPESSTLRPEARVKLLREFLLLAKDTGCLAAAPTIAEIACTDSRAWITFGKNAFVQCLLALEDLALRFDEFAFGKHMDRSQLAALLTQLVYCEPFFEPRFAPRMLVALIAATPQQLALHLAMLGPYVSRMHQSDPTQASLAHMTAKRIVDKALVPLRDVFPTLKLSSDEDRDVWLFRALFGKDGPLAGIYIGRENGIFGFVKGEGGEHHEAAQPFNHSQAMRALHRWGEKSLPPKPRKPHPDFVASSERWRRNSQEFFGSGMRNFQLPNRDAAARPTSHPIG